MLKILTSNRVLLIISLSQCRDDVRFIDFTSNEMATEPFLYELVAGWAFFS